MKHKILLLFLFLFLCNLNFISASISDSTLVQTSPNLATSNYNMQQCASTNLANYFLQFNSDGTKLFVNCVTNNFTQYNLTIPYDLSTLVLNTQNGSLGTSSFASYIANNGLDFYFGSSYIDGGMEKPIIYHYKLNNPFDLSTMTYQDNLTMSQVGSSVPASFGYLGTMYISPNGTNLLFSQLDFGVTGHNLGFWITLSQPYNLTTFSVKRNNVFSNGNVSNGNGYFSSSGLNYFEIIEPPNTIYGSFNVAQVILNQTYDLSSFNSRFTFQTATDTFRNGIFVFSDDTGNPFWVTMKGNNIGTAVYIEKYSFTNVITPTITNATNPSLLNNIVSPIIALFPDSDTLTFKQKIGFVAIVMFLTALLILIASASGGHDNFLHHWVFYIIILVEIAEYFFFTAIGYIPIGVLVIGAILLIAISYFKLKGGSNG